MTDVKMTEMSSIELEQGTLVNRQPDDTSGNPADNRQISLDGFEQPWLRLPGESAKWYGRFEIYLSLGTERNVHMAYHKVRRTRKEAAEVNKWQPPTTGSYRQWYTISKQWCWQARAEAWDDYNRQNILRRNEEWRIEERETRLKIITQHLHIADAALLAAQLDTLTVEQARQLLPSLRVLLRDMLELHRTNLEPLPIFDDNHYEQEIIPFTADELGAALKELDDKGWWRVGKEGSRASIGASTLSVAEELHEELHDE